MQKIQFSGATDPGLQRKNNEDAFVAQYIWDRKHILCIAIDGVGGYEGGEEASKIAKMSIVDFLKKFPNGERLNRLKEAVVEANNKIVEERNNNPKFSQMSCVLSACLVEEVKKQINMVHIGDTRVYQFHNGELTKLSHDHSYVGYREDINDLTEEEAMNHPKRNEISRMLGEKLHKIDDRDFIEAETFPLFSNSILLLCSDGLTDLVTKVEIVEILSQENTIVKKIKLLIDLANKKGGKDNITVVLIEYRGDEVSNIEKADIIESRKLNCESALAKIENKIDEEDSKISKVKRFWVILIAIFSLLVGACGGWFAKNIYPDIEREETKSVNTDTTSTIEVNLMKSNTISSTVTVDLSDSLSVKQYIKDLNDSIQNLNDIIRSKDEKISILKKYY